MDRSGVESGESEPIIFSDVIGAIFANLPEEYELTSNPHYVTRAFEELSKEFPEELEGMTFGKPGTYKYSYEIDVAVDNLLQSDLASYTGTFVFDEAMKTYEPFQRVKRAKEMAERLVAHVEHFKTVTDRREFMNV